MLARLKVAGLPSHFTKHSFGVGGSLMTHSMSGTAVDEIMKIWGWKTRAVVENCIVGPTTTRGVHMAGSKRKSSEGYCDSNQLPLSAAFTRDFTAHAPRNS